jgi:hypothetical protein
VSEVMATSSRNRTRSELRIGVMNTFGDAAGVHVAGGSGAVVSAVADGGGPSIALP